VTQRFDEVQWGCLLFGEAMALEVEINCLRVAGGDGSCSTNTYEDVLMAEVIMSSW
jgi:hypothetical protein